MELSEELVDFIGRYFHSLEKLEILLLFCEDSNRSWTSHQVFEMIRSTEKSVKEQIAKLAREGFIKELSDSPGSYIRKEDESRQAELTRTLTALYPLWRVKVIETIFNSKPDHTVNPNSRL